MRKRIIKVAVGCSSIIIGMCTIAGCTNNSQTPTTQYEVEASQEGLDITIDWSEFDTGKKPSVEKKTTAKGQKQTTTKKSQQTTTKKEQQNTTKKQNPTTTEEYTTEQYTTQEEYTTPEPVIFERYETITDANHEGGVYAVYSNGTKEKVQDVKWRKDLAQQVFNKIEPLRKENGDKPEYGLSDRSKTPIWSEDVYKLGQDAILEMLDYFDAQKYIPGYRINVNRLKNANIWSDETKIQFVWEAWTNVNDSEGKWDMLDLMKGAMNAAGISEEAVVCYQYGDVVYWIYLAKV